MTQCLLCPAMARPKAKWSSVLDEQVSKSLSKLLEDSDDIIVLFNNANYCGSCQEFVLDVDFLMRSFSQIQTKIIKYRSKLSQCLVDNTKVWDDQEDNDRDFQLGI